MAIPPQSPIFPKGPDELSEPPDHEHVWFRRAITCVLEVTQPPGVNLGRDTIFLRVLQREATPIALYSHLSREMDGNG